MSVTRFDSSYAERLPSPLAEVPGKLPDLSPTGPEIRLALDFPNDSPLLLNWLQAGGGTIVYDQLSNDDSHANDSTWRQGQVAKHDGTTAHRFEFRATPPGKTSRVGYRALSVVIGSKFPPRGWLSGRLIPNDELVQTSLKRAA